MFVTFYFSAIVNLCRKPELESVETKKNKQHIPSKPKLYSSVSDPDPHSDGHPGSGSALETQIPDPDPAAIKYLKNEKILNIFCNIFKNIL